MNRARPECERGLFSRVGLVDALQAVDDSEKASRLETILGALRCSEDLLKLLE